MVVHTSTKEDPIVTYYSPKTASDAGNPLGLETESAVQKFLLVVMGDVCINSSLADAARTYLSTKPSTRILFKMNKYHHSGGKVVLVGDAAHTMSSHFGQGMACGISSNWNNTDLCIIEVNVIEIASTSAV